MSTDIKCIQIIKNNSSIYSLARIDDSKLLIIDAMKKLKLIDALNN
jgi:hypothetical protein